MYLLLIGLDTNMLGYRTLEYKKVCACQWKFKKIITDIKKTFPLQLNCKLLKEGSVLCLLFME